MVEYWKEVSKDLGRTKIGSVHTIYFEALENIPEIHSITASCGCTSVKNLEGNKLKVTYTVKPVPKHLKRNHITEYRIMKYVTVVFKTGETTVLSIIGTAYQ